LGNPPLTEELRARRFGHVLFSTAEDHPWSQYFCCMLAGNRDYVRNHPVATKRVLRAILKAADLCANEPALVARRIVDAGFAARYTTTGGGIMTRKIPSVSTRCGCVMSDSSNPRRKRSSPRARIGASSTSSSTN